MDKFQGIKLFLPIIAGIIIYFLNLNYGTESLSLEPGTTTFSSIEIRDTVQRIILDWYPTSTTGQVITHDNYTLSYSEGHEQAEWVAYELIPEHLSRIKIERPGFKKDKLVSTKSAHTYDYRHSGYDRGHLCPAADCKQSEAAYDETFLMSNVTPQEHQFNAGIWLRLEEKVRYWATHYNGIKVITGGVLQTGLPTIGTNKVSVPNYFYKILYRESEGKPQMIGLLFPHKASNKALYSYVVSVDKIEEETGIDFFSQLPDVVEDRLEAKADIKGWLFQ